MFLLLHDINDRSRTARLLQIEVGVICLCTDAMICISRRTKEI